MLIIIILKELVLLQADFEKLEEQKKCPSGTLPSWDAITVIEYNFDSEQINESMNCSFNFF